MPVSASWTDFYLIVSDKMIRLENSLNRIPIPCYVMEESLLRRNLSLIQRVAQAADVEVILAFKAFALWKSFSIFREYITHSTASSPDEARLAWEEFGSRAHTYSPAYEEETFDEILRYSSHVSFNSLSQYERFEPAVAAFNRSGERVSVGLRVNPEYAEIATELYNPCAPGSRFGVLRENLPAQLPPDIEGFHIHCHCESGAEQFVRTLTHIEAKFADWFPQLKWINFGGGHLMTRQGYDIDLLVSTLKAFHQRYPWLRVILEPGSAFAWQTGTLLARVVDIVENHGIRTAILNVSFTCHMPDCLEMPYQPEIRGAEICQKAGTGKEKVGATGEGYVYRIGGNSCLSGDYMGDWKFQSPLRVGDVIIFEDMIHYTTVKTTAFNGVRHPAIGMLHEDGSFELYRQFGYEDFKNRMD